MRYLFRYLACVALLGAAAPAFGQVSLNADAYLDQLKGMWVGQLVGNYAGRGKVPGTTRDREGYVVRGGADFDLGWSDFLATPVWTADDDTVLEYLNVRLILDNPDPLLSDLQNAWDMHVRVPGRLYIANRQARWLINRGIADSGSLHRNMNWYAIDSQITTEAMGATAPGMMQRGADLAGIFGSVSNDGYSLHAAQYYAALYAASAVEADIEQIVDAALGVVPASSRSHQVITDVINLYEDQKQNNTLDWRDTQRMLYDHYGSGPGSNHRYRYWIESTVNLGLTVMSLLYGEGDFVKTVEIGVLAGYDADCNPATAGGMLGLMYGYDAILASLQPSDPSDPPVVLSQDYDANHSTTQILHNFDQGILGGPLLTLDEVAGDFRQAAEAQILLVGGSITGEGSERTYWLPDVPLQPREERFDPDGPRGLVGEALARDIDVSISANVDQRVANNDRRNLNRVINGISDYSYNGHLAYTTRSGTRPGSEDFYQIDFGRLVLFDSMIFHEGDIIWANINGDPWIQEPRGGYFLDLLVEVGLDGVFTPVANLELSEELDPMSFLQQIEMTFDLVWGDAIRIRGTAGGTEGFTSLVELEAFGLIPQSHDDALWERSAAVKTSALDILRQALIDELLPSTLDINSDGLVNHDDLAYWVEEVHQTRFGDLNLDGRVDDTDLAILQSNLGLIHAGWGDGNMTLDHRATLYDAYLLFAHYGFERSAPTSSTIPEPGLTLLWAVAVSGALMRRRLGRSLSRKARNRIDNTWCSLRPSVS